MTGKKKGDPTLHPGASADKLRVLLSDAYNENRSLKAQVFNLERRPDLTSVNTPLAIPMILHCPMPSCGARHIDEGEFATKIHHTHACQTCGHVWRPALVATVGVQFLPGYKNGAS